MQMILLICGLLLAARQGLTSTTKSSAEDGPYKVYRVIPRNTAQMDVLSWLRDNAVEYELDIWKETSGLGSFMDIMVPPSMVPVIEELFHKEGIEYVVTIPDVRSLIERNEVYPRNANDVARTAKQRSSLLEAFFARSKDDPILDEEADGSEESLNKIGDLKAKYRFGDYGSYKDMLKFMRTIEFYYPHITKLVRIGLSHEGTPIEGLKIGYPINETNKRAFWIDGNIHAREWASSHTALYFINQLVSGFGKDPIITNYVESLNIYIFPCLNPDGYEYTRSEPIPQSGDLKGRLSRSIDRHSFERTKIFGRLITITDIEQKINITTFLVIQVRLWRKNRSPQKCVRSLWGGRRCCEGVDLNRNFDFHWAEVGSSENPCSHLYQGESAFSEPETRAVKDFLLSDEMQDKLDGFITLHTYAQLWIHPYSHEVETFPDNYVELRRTAKRAVDRLKKVYGTQYKIGTGADMLAPASGGSDDWAKDVLGVKYVYLVELRPELELSNGFILNKYDLIPTAVETWEGVQAVLDDVLRVNNLSTIDNKPPAITRDATLGRFILNNTPTNVATLPRRTAGIARKLSGIKIAPESDLNDDKVQYGTTGSRVHFRNGNIKTISSNSMVKIDGVTKVASTTNSALLITNLARPIKIIRPDYPVFRPSSSSLSQRTSSSTSSLARNHRKGDVQFLDPNCKDIRISCGFWLRSNPEVCTEQYQFMKSQCARTCKFCAHLSS